MGDNYYIYCQIRIVTVKKTKINLNFFLILTDWLQNIGAKKFIEKLCYIKLLK